MWETDSGRCVILLDEFVWQVYNFSFEKNICTIQQQEILKLVLVHTQLYSDSYDYIENSYLETAWERLDLTTGVFLCEQFILYCNLVQHIESCRNH